ncbi:hypothetical protein ANN_18010 [Periplaneta americana]|uniref:Uncharacterized protein n=1 Tax=Periplaneta americana TaxID=6978 RepID=A0ABQ8SNT0_PERAM|nr:hypothetical protein ANN_18010 [Periplaneta americana]
MTHFEMNNQLRPSITPYPRHRTPLTYPRLHPPLISHRRLRPTLTSHPRLRLPLTPHPRLCPPLIAHPRLCPPLIAHPRLCLALSPHTRLRCPLNSHPRLRPSITPYPRHRTPLTYPRLHPPLISHRRLRPTLTSHPRLRLPLTPHPRLCPPLIAHPRLCPPLIAHPRLCLALSPHTRLRCPLNSHPRLRPSITPYPRHRTPLTYPRLHPPLISHRRFRPTLTSHHRLRPTLTSHPRLRPTLLILHFRNGAPLHFDRCVRNHLNATFPDCWIGRGGPVPWPPRSPDLTPLDFFLWGDVKRFVYEIPIDTAEDLVARVVEAAHVIRDNVGLFERCRHSIVRRCMADMKNIEELVRFSVLRLQENGYSSHSFIHLKNKVVPTLQTLLVFKNFTGIVTSRVTPLLKNSLFTDKYGCKHTEIKLMPKEIHILLEDRQVPHPIVICPKSCGINGICVAVSFDRKFSLSERILTQYGTKRKVLTLEEKVEVIHQIENGIKKAYVYPGLHKLCVLRAGSQLMSGMQILAALCIRVDWKKG